ncbi:hypothetical protein KI387_014142, partial [Taxus chinensis]
PNLYQKPKTLRFDIMVGPSTRALKNLVTLGKTLDKDEIVIEEMDSEGVNTNSSALG